MAAPHEKSALRQPLVARGDATTVDERRLLREQDNVPDTVKKAAFDAGKGGDARPAWLIPDTVEQEMREQHRADATPLGATDRTAIEESHQAGVHVPALAAAHQAAQ